jgi:eukaryotic-like serine/threonine-protein kinase
MTVLALVFAFGYFARAPSPPRVIRAYIKPAANSNFLLAGAASSGFALSPDGLRVTYVASTPEGKPLLWVRPIDSFQAQLLAGTENAAFPFWSPDSRFIGFFADGKLKKIEASGGPPWRFAMPQFHAVAPEAEMGLLYLLPPSMRPCIKYPPPAEKPRR